MTVLVYGDWNKATANIKSFFTTYSQNDCCPMSLQKKIVPICICWCFSKGKNPLYAIKIVEKLRANG
jgi:hypothetical protein